MPRLPILAALALLAASACGGSGGSNEPSGFLARSSDGAVYIQWTRSESSVTGTITIARRETDDEGYESVQTDDVAFEGVINGKSITLKLGGTNWNGTLDGDDLTLTYSADDGSLQTLDFEPESLSSYNEAVADLQGSVQAANDEMAQVDADAEAAVAIDTSARAVREDISKLNGYVQSAQRALDAIPDAIASAQDALDSTYNALQDTRSAGQLDCGAYAGDTSAYAADVSAYKADVDAYLYDVNSDLAAIDETLARLRSDFRQLRSGLAGLPDYRPYDLPTKAQVDAARSAVGRSVAEIVRSGRGYRQQSAQLVRTAEGYANQASAACG